MWLFAEVVIGALLIAAGLLWLTSKIGGPPVDGDGDEWLSLP